jgi:hypothetical protein
MIGYKLSDEQYNDIQGQEFAPFERFNCVQDVDGIWFNFVSEQQIPQVESSQYAWVLNLPTAEYTPPPSPEFPI